MGLNVIAIFGENPSPHANLIEAADLVPIETFEQLWASEWPPHSTIADLAVRYSGASFFLTYLPVHGAIGCQQAYSDARLRSSACRFSIGGLFAELPRQMLRQSIQLSQRFRQHPDSTSDMNARRPHEPSHMRLTNR
jgi:hypothetical protein